MSSVWYIGSANQRTITGAQWARAIGSGSFSDTTWNKDNGFSLPQAGFTTPQLNFLAADVEFSVGQADGARTSITPNPLQNKDSAVAYYQAVKSLTSASTSSKLLNVGDNGFHTSLLANVVSTVGTGEHYFIVGQAVTGIALAWHHWYTDLTNPKSDKDPSGSISFNAGIRVVSSTNPGTVTGQLYRLTFGGRTTANLDAGGKITSDVLGISLAAGDVIAVRTFLASGTAYSPRRVWGSGDGGFTATTDLTAPGSGAVTAVFNGLSYGPSELLGYVDTPNTAKSVFVIGDSIGIGLGDSGASTTQPTKNGGFFARALSGKAGLLNAAVGGDCCSYFQATNGSFHRLGGLPRCNDAVIQYATNDITLPLTAAVTEAINIDLAIKLKRLGTNKVFITTLVPRTTSTDGWATTTNQTPLSTESQRVAYNNWVRALCPIDPITLVPVTPGTSPAIVAGQFGHPINGIFDVCATVETSLNSGLWLPANRVVTGSITSGQAVVTSAGANFVNTNQEVGGDIGTLVNVHGAGASGIDLIAAIAVVTNSTTVTIGALASTTVSSVALVIGPTTLDGVHPSPSGHNLMSKVIDLSVL